MMTQVLHCPYGHGTAIVRHGTTPEGKQRSRCRACPERGRTFLLAYAYAGQSPVIKQHLVDRAMNASGMRDTARVVHVSPTTVLLVSHNFAHVCQGGVHRRASGATTLSVDDHEQLPGRGALRLGLFWKFLRRHERHCRIRSGCARSPHELLGQDFLDGALRR